MSPNNKKSRLGDMSVNEQQIASKYRAGDANGISGQSSGATLPSSPESDSLSYPDPEFCNFEEGREERKFSADQIWAIYNFKEYLTNGLDIVLYQLDINSFIWEEGPRLKMNLKLFPDRVSLFNASEVLRIRSMFIGWLVPDSNLFGPYELISFTLGSYAKVIPSSSTMRLRTCVLVGIVLGAIAGADSITAVFLILIMRRSSRYI